MSANSVIRETDQTASVLVVDSPLNGASVKSKSANLEILSTAGPDIPVSLRSLTLVLAYIHKSTPSILPRRRFLSPVPLRELAVWIGRPEPRLRSIRNCRPLLAHFALLQAAGLLRVNEDAISLDSGVADWLHANAADQLHSLLAAQNSPAWQQTLCRYGWQTIIGPDYEAYITQWLRRQLATATHANGVLNSCPVSWSANQLAIELHDDLPLWLLFDLLQLGDWRPGQPLICTPLTLNRARARGYGQPVILWLLETAVKQNLAAQSSPPLPPLLDEWFRQGRAYRLHNVLLLETAQADQLETVLTQTRFKPYIKAQISPRHAVVTAELPPMLHAWLQRQSGCGQAAAFHITASVAQGAVSPITGCAHPSFTDESTELDYYWLGLRLLVGLGEMMPQPYPAPFAHLERLGEQLSPLQRDALETRAQRLLQQLRSLIRGQDAFLPAAQPVSRALLDSVETAIAQQRSLAIHYQSPADHEPRYRRVQPLRLEQRGALYYLYAYCYRAEADLVFRLDRVSNWELD